MVGNRAQESNTLMRGSNFFQEKGEFEKAIALKLQALAISHALDLNTYTFELYKSLHRCYFQSGQLAQSYQYALRAQEMEGYILDERRMKAFDEIEVKYRTAEREKQLALIENERLRQSKELLKSRWAIAVLALGLLLAALAARNLQQKKRFAQYVALQNQTRHEGELAQMRKEREAAAMMSLFIGQEQERRRIANDLHDSLGGLLYSMQLQLSKAENPPADLRQTLENAIAENRRISQNLLPVTLARLGLCAALREWASQFEKTQRLPVHLDLPEEALTLPDEVSISLFRIAQELMNNAARHARATEISLHLLPDGDKLTLLVEDNGTGFDPAAQSVGFLKTVHSRTQLLGGSLHVDSQAGRGTTVIVEVGKITQ